MQSHPPCKISPLCIGAGALRGGGGVQGLRRSLCYPQAL
ncbi:hypothetical protein EIO_0618 [Ketogulonicigenium vulgare Y25]|uniref:Uncharacterized protein n=1 Tax=Ketogulonicigenium vulgare (strain WSH-001) TaxID=759362 RepID=F9Y8K5_KETVW|nr:hypothetical protein EIO_0618 [Ketogulonicigenium vulgare Y25]AEM40014.1 hypothetical protein KVU_0175 [Ketogulonicigenium vulgare WSH-001]ALJ80218.1 hypothetical protein KVH_02925 [Ketogulonicigenium vulgare]